MTRTETKPTVESRSTNTSTRAHRNGSNDCRCGQQLDMGARAHCPRCGRSITR